MDTTPVIFEHLDNLDNLDNLRNSPKGNSQNTKCEHRVYRCNCTWCNPDLLCKHDIRGNKCIKCVPRLRCPHGNHKYKCSMCVRSKPYDQNRSKKIVTPKVPRKCIHGVLEVGCYTCIQNSLNAQYFKDFHSNTKK